MNLLHTLLFELKPLEIVAALVSIASVVLTARQHISNFPVGILACILYGVVFWEGNLLASAGLQGFFIAICLWDWRQWAKGEGGGGDLCVRRTPFVLWAILLGVCIAGTGAQGFLLQHFTRAESPWIDTGLSWTSMGAQWMVGRKYIENWAIWIAVDAFYVWFYWMQRLTVTSVLYALFCLLAVWGWFEWKRSGIVSTRIEPRPDGPPIALP